jgi:transcriptional regulator of met regulon
MAKKDSTLTLELLNELFYYSDGNLYRKKTTQKNVQIHKKVGTVNVAGYVVVNLHNKVYLVHRLIYWMQHKHLPKYIDHIDGNRSNNQLHNLRAATNQQNICNAKLRKNSTSGIKNVRWDERLKKWSVRFTVNYKPKHIGVYFELGDAIQAANKARQELHGQFARDC